MLTGLPYVAAVVLAVVFAAAAAAKWRDPAGTARAFRALGVPSPWRSARLVPAVETLLAFGLLWRPGLFAAAALALLVAFSVFLIDRLHRGVDAPCNCFGSWGSGGALSWSDILRNGWLVLAALLAVAAARPATPSVAAILVAAAVLLLAVLSVRVTRRHPSS